MINIDKRKLQQPIIPGAWRRDKKKRIPCTMIGVIVHGFAPSAGTGHSDGSRRYLIFNDSLLGNIKISESDDPTRGAGANETLTCLMMVLSHFRHKIHCQIHPLDASFACNATIAALTRTGMSSRFSRCWSLWTCSPRSNSTFYLWATHTYLWTSGSLLSRTSCTIVGSLLARSRCFKLI